MNSLNHSYNSYNTYNSKRTLNSLQSSRYNSNFSASFSGLPNSRDEEQIRDLKEQIAKAERTKLTLQERISFIKHSKEYELKQIQDQISQAKKRAEYHFTQQKARQNFEVDLMLSDMNIEQEQFGSLVQKFMDTSSSVIDETEDFSRYINSIIATNDEIEATINQNELDIQDQMLAISKTKKQLDSDLNIYLKQQNLRKTTSELNKIRSKDHQIRMEHHSTFIRLSEELDQKAKSQNNTIKELCENLNNQDKKYQENILALQNQIAFEKEAYNKQIQHFKLKEEELAKTENQIKIKGTENMEKMIANLQVMQKALDEVNQNKDAFKEKDLEQTKQTVQLSMEKAKLEKQLEKLTKELTYTVAMNQKMETILTPPVQRKRHTCSIFS